MVVGPDVEAAEPDGQQAGSEGVGMQLGVNVRGVDDLSEAHQCPVSAEIEVVDEDLEAAFVAPRGLVNWRVWHIDDGPSVGSQFGIDDKHGQIDARDGFASQIAGTVER